MGRGITRLRTSPPLLTPRTTEAGTPLTEQLHRATALPAQLPRKPSKLRAVYEVRNNGGRTVVTNDGCTFALKAVAQYIADPKRYHAASATHGPES